MTKNKIQLNRAETDNKMPVISHFYPLLMKTSAQVKASYVGAFQMSGKMIGLLDFRVSGFRCEDLQVLDTYTLLSPNVK